ncbi:MAG TPA: aldo/keto reductase [Actinomycetota bacterium]|nr:aldo/keto reductase [Actinomycetota bacterium]
MRTARLGRDGPTISRVGIGGFQAGGRGPWGAGPDADDGAAVAAIRAAVGSGVTWVETAASYGLGHSEEVVARALEPWRIGEEVLVFSKCGHPWEPPDRIWTELAPATIRRQCEESLARLRVERIDLYQFHHPDPNTPVEESWATLAELVDEGKVRWAGVSNFGVDLLERCEAIRHVDSLSPELSLLRPQASSDVIPWCRDHGTGVIVYSPIASGLLSGARDPAWLSAAADEDRMGVSAEAITALVDGLRPLAERLGIPVPALAAAWTLSVEGVTGAICGARRPDQVEGWIAAGDVELSPDDVRRIGSVLGLAGIGGTG